MKILYLTRGTAAACAGQVHSPEAWLDKTSAASEFKRSAALLRRSKSCACSAARERSRRYLRSTRSMKEERECLEPASRSTSSKTSFESVIEVFNFILLSYY